MCCVPLSTAFFARCTFVAAFVAPDGPSVRALPHEDDTVDSITCSCVPFLCKLSCQEQHKTLGGDMTQVLYSKFMTSARWVGPFSSIWTCKVLRCPIVFKVGKKNVLRKSCFIQLHINELNDK